TGRNTSMITSTTARPMMGNRVFLDSSYAIALASRTDQYHPQAIELSRHISNHRVRLLTTRSVCFEVANALAKPRFRSIAVGFLNCLEASATAEIVPASEELYRHGFDLYRERPDKDWSLTDCVSFLVMRERGVTEALTSDEHFEQA